MNNIHLMFILKQLKAEGVLSEEEVDDCGLQLLKHDDISLEDESIPKAS